MEAIRGTGNRRFEHLQMQQIVKRFPGVLACDSVDFDVKAGEIHALLGENGAGKSTLMKMIYGLYRPNEGTIKIDGKTVNIRSPQEAIENGIGMIHQHFMLVPSLTVAENVALGMNITRRGLLNLDKVTRELEELSSTYNLKVDPRTPVWQLAVGEQQRVEILRALYKGAALLILDEPTAVLIPQEVDDLFQILRRMAEDGHGLIFISHKLHEVLSISDRITILRDGRRVNTIATSSATRSSLAEMMVGRPVVLQYEHSRLEPGPERLRLDGVSAFSDRGNLGLKSVSLTLHANEIVGVAGVSGNGQHELAQVIAGLRPAANGQIYIDDQNVTRHSPAKMNEMGLSYIPEERMLDGVIKDFSVAENYVLQDHGREPFIWGKIFMDFRAIATACRDAIRDYEIKTPDIHTPIKSLSGGNIQKVVLARELARNPHVLIAAQPTRGVDIGATEYIHHRLLEEREKGTAILLISEDLDEILELSDRIAVMYEGVIIGIVYRDAVSLNELGIMMAGSQLGLA
jgi:general nucleoside transport system ATP-binding protein